MMPDVNAMLSKADAALVVQDNPKKIELANTLALDLVEEWNDLTGLPYIHGFWVGREEELSKEEADALLIAKNNGVLLKSQIAQSAAQQRHLSINELTSYLSSFSYILARRKKESLAEFINYAYFHGVIGDVPEILFFDLETNDLSRN